MRKIVRSLDEAHLQGVKLLTDINHVSVRKWIREAKVPMGWACDFVNMFVKMGWACDLYMN